MHFGASTNKAENNQIGISKDNESSQQIKATVVFDTTSQRVEQITSENQQMGNENKRKKRKAWGTSEVNE